MPDETNTDTQNLFPHYPDKYKVIIDELPHSLRVFLTDYMKQMSGEKDSKAKNVKVETWKKNGFDLRRAIEETNGPMLEIGGPTTYDQDPLDFTQLKKQLIVSNITKGTNWYHDQTGEFLGKAGKVDVLMDGTSLALKSGSIGVVFASSLPRPVRSRFMTEAVRVLEDNGILVFQSGLREDIKNANRNGLQTMEFKKVKNKEGQVIYDAIFCKTPKKPFLRMLVRK